MSADEVCVVTGGLRPFEILGAIETRQYDGDTRPVLARRRQELERAAVPEREICDERVYTRLHERIPCMSPRSFADPIASACLRDEDDGCGVERASARVARERALGDGVREA